MRTLITVDWDFFVKEDPAWDFGHAESLLFLDVVWQTRAGLIDQIKTDGNEVDFWKVLDRKADLSNADMAVSESHCMAHRFAQIEGVDRIVHFDAHHDCWKSRGKAGEVYCDDWLRVWLGHNKRRSAVWVQPDWLDEEICPVPTDMAGRLETRKYCNIGSLCVEGVVAVHVCRSGCWVPPWLDSAFTGFLKRSGRALRDFLPLQDGRWSPLKERWNKQEMKEVIEREKKVQEQFAAMRAGNKGDCIIF